MLDLISWTWFWGGAWAGTWVLSLVLARLARAQRRALIDELDEKQLMLEALERREGRVQRQLAAARPIMRAADELLMRRVAVQDYVQRDPAMDQVPRQVLDELGQALEKHDDLMVKMLSEGEKA